MRLARNCETDANGVFSSSSGSARVTMPKLIGCIGWFVCLICIASWCGVAAEQANSNSTFSTSNTSSATSQTLVDGTSAAVSTKGGPLELFVSLAGNDSWSGRLAEPNSGGTDGPFRSLGAARNAIRKLKRAGGLPPAGVVVSIRGGFYSRNKPFELTSQDSGNAQARIVYRAYPGETVRIAGGVIIKKFRPLGQKGETTRIAPAARDHVLVADLKAAGITDYGSPAGRGLELFYNGEPMTLARWPNEGFTHIADIVGKPDVRVHGRTGTRTGKFKYEGERPARWVDEPDLWVHGYWFWDWSDQRHKVKRIDPATRTIELQPPYHHYGYRKGQWYYAFNALCELDQPGEWYLDRQRGLLYFWPPDSKGQGEAIVSVAQSLVTFKDVSFVTIKGLTFEAARGTAITVTGGESVQIESCTIRNVGAWAVTVRGGRGHKIASCHIYATAAGGTSLVGGDRKTLTPAEHEAYNNHIHHYARWYRMYQAGIHLSGVGNRARHNLIHHAPHQAISFSGNDHLIEFNEIHNVCLESNDAGAIYSGRDWTMRGTVIRHNYFHDISGFRNRGCMGVYLDDMFCGTRIEGNVFYKVTRAAFIGGGRDNAIVNNIFVECRPAVHVDARAMGWASYHVKTTMTQRLKSMPYTRPPWSVRYPRLVTILEDEPAAPKGNLIERNICVGGRWAHIDKKAEPYITVRNNLIDVDPHFVDPAHQDFRLKPTSPAPRRIGFKPIPFEEIGLVQSDSAESADD